jgi:hypothetical protein
MDVGMGIDAADQQPDTPDSPEPDEQRTAPPAFTVPEKFAGKSLEDVVRSYTELESQYGKVSGLQSQLEQMGGMENLRQWATYGNQAYQAALAAQQQAQSRQSAQPTQPTSAEDPFENWDALTPREQGQKLSQMVAAAATQYINAYGQQFATHQQKQLQDQAAALNTQWEIYRTVQEVARKNPGVDTNELMQRMAKIATGDLHSLMDIAMTQLTGQADIAAEVQRRLADERLKDQNKQISVLTNAGRSSVKMPDSPGSPDDTRALIMKKLLESGTLSPGQF